MENVIIYGFAPSTYVRTARMVCEEKQIAYTLSPLEFQAESHRDIHPYLKMPAMHHGQVTLFETLAISIYLNEEFPGPDLEAGTAIERARMFQWISAANDRIYNGIVGILAKGEASDLSFIDDSMALLEPVDQALRKQSFLAGDDMTLADLFLLPMLLYAEKNIDDADWLSPWPDLSAWTDRLRDRPSVSATES